MTIDDTVQKGTIIVAEDEEMIRDLCKVFLGGEGYRILDADDGKPALDLYKQHKDDVCLVISDGFMLEMHGAQLVTEIRKINPYQKILMMTGTRAELENSLTDEQPNKILQKPFSKDTLLQTVYSITASPELH